VRIISTDEYGYTAVVTDAGGTEHTVTAPSLNQLKDRANDLLGAWHCRHHKDLEERFLAVWKSAVLLVGQEYFDVRSRDVLSATRKDQLCPRADIDRLRKGLAPKKRRLLAVMLGLYNPEIGADFLKHRTDRTVGYITWDKVHARLASELLRWFPGW